MSDRSRITTGSGTISGASGFELGWDLCWLGLALWDRGDSDILDAALVFLAMPVMLAVFAMLAVLVMMMFVVFVMVLMVVVILAPLS